MRKTSQRRRATSYGYAYSGRGIPKKGTPRASVAVEEGTPGSIVCASCGTAVPVLVNGRPRAHAAGGTVPSIRRGEYKCEGSGRE